jgi:hypothetical protein
VFASLAGVVEAGNESLAYLFFYQFFLFHTVLKIKLFKFRKYFFTTNFTNCTNLAARC